MKKTLFSLTLIVSLFVLNGFAQDLFQKGLTQYDAKQYDEAAATFKQVVAQSPNNYAAFYNLGLCYYFLKRYDESIPSFQQAVKIQPDYVKAYIFMGNAFDILGRYNEAVTAYKTAIQFEPNNFSAHYELGIAHKLQKNYIEAEKSFRRATEINPNNVNAKTELGYAYLNLKMFPDAIANFNRAISLKPDHADAFMGLGSSYYNDKKFADAIPHYKKATELLPTWKTPHLYLADAYLNSAQYSLAIIAYNKAISLDNKLADAYYGLGMSYFKQNNRVMANQTLDTLRTIDNVKANLLAEKMGATSTIATIPTPKTTPTPKPTPKTAQRIKDEQDVAKMADFGFDGAVVTQVSSIKDTPKLTGKTLLAVKRGDILSLVSRDDSNNWFQVVDEKSGFEGWIDGKTVVVKLTTNTETGPPILESGRTETVEANPVVLITNNEEKTTLSIRLNGTLYQIPPGTTKTVTVPAGKFSYYGWSKGIRPATGSATLQKGKKYSWSFKIYRR